MCIARVGAGDPDSLIAAEIHRGCWPAGITGGWLELPYSKHVPVQQSRNYIIDSVDYLFCAASSDFQFMPFQKA